MLFVRFFESRRCREETSMSALIIERSQQWYEARCGIPTASVLDAVMSDGRKAGEFGKPFWSLVDTKAWEMLGHTAYIGGTGYAAQRGTDLEPVAIAAYEERTGVTVNRPGFLLHPTLRFGGTPDGTIGNTHTLQVKCPETPGKVVALRCDGDVSEYAWQCQGEMLVTGAVFCHLCVFDDRLPEPDRLTVIRVDRDEGAIGRIEERVERFNESVTKRVAQFRGKL